MYLMAKKKIEVFVDIKNEQQFECVLNHNQDRLICANIYNSFAGPCTALDYLFVRIKLDWSDGNIVLLRVLIDEIYSLSRFHNRSEPVFLFIMNRKITRIFRGVDNMGFAQAAKYEIDCFKQLKEGSPVDRITYDLDEASPEELEWYKERLFEKQQEEARAETRRMERQAARKRHRSEIMIPHLQHLNFVLYWPHAMHAHPELYERWNVNNIIMVGREDIQLTKETVFDVLYAGDAELNEASLHMLLSAPALAICFRLLDTEKHFVSLVRRILYEEVAPIDESHALKTAFDAYKSYSLSRDEILKKRREDRLRKKEEVVEKRARRLSEMQRLARQAIEDAIQAKRAAKEQRKLELLKTGNLSALENLKQEPDDDEVNIAVPDLVLENVTPEPEFLPPHVLVMMNIEKRYKAIAAMSKYNKEIIHMGIFKATCPFDAFHIAYSVKQFDDMQKNKTYKLDKLRLAFMLSIKCDLALLELVDLGPVYVSRDSVAGEDECAALFSFDYADHYPEFEDF
ncbi:thioredoxin domain-containing protein 3 homolog isoform X2 [Maniola hyperantus]|uniref:thioredoxin domain-containing protein 3 homolog isoform X2 n=1 Tax=Aphantopus hyperantus TaxID=2795564 RepID=UPI001568981C|nr:uncharacterized protein LOC117992088 isoform X3 [Maniola hyperantus]